MPRSYAIMRCSTPIFECRSGNLRPQRQSQRIFRAEFIWSKPSPVASKVPPNSPTNNPLNVSNWSLLQLMNLLFSLGYLFVQAVLGTMKDPSSISSRRESAGRACTDALRTLPAIQTCAPCQLLDGRYPRVPCVAVYRVTRAFVGFRWDLLIKRTSEQSLARRRKHPSTCGFESWAVLGSNQRPLRCKCKALP
jgi:hypothetical protein